MTINAHAQAVLNLLDADNTSPALVVYDGVVPDGIDPRTSPYVLVYFATSTPNAGDAPDKVDLTANSNVVQVDAYCHSVGGSGAAARIVATRVRTALLNVRPTIAGRVCFPIRHVDNQPPQRDEGTGSLVVDQVDVYRLLSVPA